MDQKPRLQVVKLATQLTTPNDGVVEDLKKLLAQAEKGEIEAIVYATVNEADDVSCNWAGQTASVTLIGAVHMLEFLLTTAAFQGVKDDA